MNKYIKKQNDIKSNILNSFVKEDNLEKGEKPKNKWQKIIWYKWQDAIKNETFKDYTIKELGGNLEDVSYTEQERLLRDREGIVDRKIQRMSPFNETPKESKI